MSSDRSVLFVISSLRRAGAQTQLVYIATGLAQRGWTVKVLYYDGMEDSALRRKLEVAGVVPVALKSPFGIHLRSPHRSFFNLARLFPIVRRYRPDAIIGFLYPGIMAARIVGRAARVPVVISSIRSEREFSRRDALIRITDFLTDAVTTMSHNIAADLVHRRITRELRMHVVPNIVDVQIFNPESDDCRTEIRRQLRVADNEFLWLAVSRIAPAKDLPNLLTAFYALLRRKPQARLLIAGDGPLRGEIENQIRQMELSDRVRLLGMRTDTPSLYRACDAYVMSSAWEGIPSTILEAMACKRPVVATSVGGVKEVVTNCESGFTVTRKDHGALADAMDLMMTLPALSRERLGQAGYDRVHSECTADRVIGRWENLITSLLKREDVCR